MSELEIPAAVPQSAGLSQWQRVSNIFTAPSKTFNDIKAGNRSWWLPFILFVVVGTALCATVTVKVGWHQVVENGLRVSPKAAEAIEKMPPEQRQMNAKISAISQEVVWFLAPVGVLLLNLIAAGVLLGTINFGFGGKANFRQVLAVSWYAGLPGLLKLLLGLVGLFAGVEAESFLPGNAAGTNLGYFFLPPETPVYLWTLLTAVDITFLWTLVLFSKGLAKVAGVKDSSGYAAVFGWWILLTLIQVGIASAMS
jgi:hypothetical protein